jgi:hypothetical protein
MKDNTIIIEFDGPQNQSILFQPLQRKLRGRFDPRRMANAGRLHNEWPQGVPGQRLQLNVSTGEAAIVEPLWDAQHNAIRERIEAKGMKLPPGREEIKADVATWIYWLKPLVETGKAKVLSGEFPTKVEGTPRTRFHSEARPDAVETAVEKLASAIER